jgi:hypothetical protein
MRKPPLPVPVILLLPLALLTVAPAGSAWSADPPRACAVEPRAYKVLHDAVSYLSAARQFTFKVEGTRDQVQEEGRQIQFGSSDTVAVRRPNGLRMDSANDAGEFTAWYDGKRFTLLNREDRSYYTAAMPDTFDETLSALSKEYKFTFPLGPFIRTDSVKRICDDAHGGFEAGIHKVRGIDCHHIVLVGENVDAQIWIDAGALPLIRKVVLTFKKQNGSPSFIGYISDWDFSASLPDSAFEAALPRGATLRPIAELAAQAKGEPKQGVKP